MRFSLTDMAASRPSWASYSIAFRQENTTAQPSEVRPPFLARPGLLPAADFRFRAFGPLFQLQQAGAQHLGASQQVGIGQHTVTGTCLHTTTGTQRVTV